MTNEHLGILSHRRAKNKKICSHLLIAQKVRTPHAHRTLVHEGIVRINLLPIWFFFVLFYLFRSHKLHQIKQIVVLSDPKCATSSPCSMSISYSLLLYFVTKSCDWFIVSIFLFFLNISKSNKYSNVVFVHVSMLFLAGCMWWEQQPNTSPVVCCGKWHMLTQVVCQKINSGDLVMCIGDTIYIYIYRCLKWTRHRHGIDQP